MPDVSVRFKIEGDSSSLNRAGSSGTQALDAVRGAAGTADAALKNMTGGVVSLGGALQTLATVAAAKAIAGFVSDGLAAADQTAKLARRLNVAAAEMAAWRRAAALAGTTQESVTKAVERGARTLLDAANGLSTSRLAFEQLGLRVEELEGLAPDALFERVARATRRWPAPLRRRSPTLHRRSARNTAPPARPRRGTRWRRRSRWRYTRRAVSRPRELG